MINSIEGFRDIKETRVYRAIVNPYNTELYSLVCIHKSVELNMVDDIDPHTIL